MKTQPRTIILKDGRKCVLCSAAPEDAEELLEVMHRLFEETKFLSSYPEEHYADVDREIDFLRGMEAKDRDVFLIAKVDGRIVANCAMTGVFSRMKSRHRASLGLSVLKEFWGLGIGSTLLREVKALAENAGYEQLELEVVEENTRAIALYEKMGFVRCGKWPRAFRYRDGSYSDFVLMVNIF